MKIKYIPGFPAIADEPYFQSIREKYSNTYMEQDYLPNVGDTVNLFDFAQYVDLTEEEAQWMLEVIYEQQVEEVRHRSDYYEIELKIE